jgi:hypothetical protein
LSYQAIWALQCGQRERDLVFRWHRQIQFFVSRMVVFLEKFAGKPIDNRIAVTAKKKTKYKGEKGVHALGTRRLTPSLATSFIQ